MRGDQGDRGNEGPSPFASAENGDARAADGARALGRGQPAGAGLDPHRRSSSFAWFTGGGTIASLFGFSVASMGVFLGCISLLAWGAPPVVALGVSGLALAACSAIAVRVSQRRLVIGRDGLTISGPFGRRHVSFADLADARLTPHGFRFLRRDGSEESIALDLYGPNHRQLVARIRHALATIPEFETSRARELLSRDGRSIAEWKDVVGRMVAPAATFRSAGLTPDQLAALLEDPAATIEQRLGAALALVDPRAGDPEASQKIRLAADASGSPRVRIALEAIAAGTLEDETLEEALAEHESSARERRARSS